MKEYEQRDGSLIHRLANIVGPHVQIGRNCRIDPFVTITGFVRIGDNTHIGTGACIFGMGQITIMDHVSVSPGVKIFTSSDGNAADENYEKERVDSPVFLDSHCEIGANCVVLAGTQVGHGAKVGALSLVKGKLMPGWLYAGTPAKPLRDLKTMRAA